MKVCVEPGCPTLTNATRCNHHARTTDTARGTRQQRGYGIEHQRLREHWAPRVNLGIVRCWRCGRLLMPDEPWDLGHSDEDRTQYRGPEHRACNRATAGRRGSPPQEHRDGLTRPALPAHGIPRPGRPARRPQRPPDPGG